MDIIAGIIYRDSASKLERMLKEVPILMATLMAEAVWLHVTYSFQKELTFYKQSFTWRSTAIVEQAEARFQSVEWPKALKNM